MKNKNRIKAFASIGDDGELFAIRNDKGPYCSEPIEIVFNNGWIHVSERRPTKRDASADGYVLVWAGRGDALCHWDNLKNTIIGHDYQWWQHCLKGPKKIGKKGRR